MRMDRALSYCITTCNVIDSQRFFPLAYPDRKQTGCCLIWLLPVPHAVFRRGTRIEIADPLATGFRWPKLARPRTTRGYGPVMLFMKVVSARSATASQIRVAASGSNKRTERPSECGDCGRRERSVTVATRSTGNGLSSRFRRVELPVLGKDTPLIQPRHVARHQGFH